MPNRFELLLPDIVGSFQQGRADVRQVNREQLADQELNARLGRENQFRQLAGQAYGARTPGEREQFVSQAAAADPQGAMALDRQMGSNEERKQQRLGVWARALTQAPEQMKPLLYRQMQPEMRSFGLDVPPEYTPEVGKMAQAFMAQQGGGVQSTIIGRDGQYYTVDRQTGTPTPTGVFADPKMQVMQQPGQMPYGVVTSRGPTGQVVPIGGGQQGAPAAPGAPMGHPQGVGAASASATSGAGPVRIPTEAETAADVARAKAGVELQTAPEIARQTQTAGTTAKTQAERQSGFIDEGLRAADSIPVINRAVELLDQVETGGLEAAKLAATNFFGITGADEGELSNNLGKAVLSQLRATFGAAFTEKEGARLSEIESGFGKSTAVNRRLLGQTKAIVERAARRGIEASRAAGDEFTAQEIERALRMTLAPGQAKAPQQQTAATSRPPAQRPATNAKGWQLMTDANGNQAYVSPDGSQFDEIK